MTHTLTLDDKTFTITDVHNVHFNISNGKNVTLEIKTKNNGDFHYECLISEKDKFNNLWALKTDIISTLKAIAEGRIVID